MELHIPIYMSWNKTKSMMADGPTTPVFNSKPYISDVLLLQLILVGIFMQILKKHDTLSNSL